MGGQRPSFNELTRLALTLAPSCQTPVWETSLSDFTAKSSLAGTCHRLPVNGCGFPQATHAAGDASAAQHAPNGTHVPRLLAELGRGLLEATEHILWELRCRGRQLPKRVHLGQHHCTVAVGYVPFDGALARWGCGAGAQRKDTAKLARQAQHAHEGTPFSLTTPLAHQTTPAGS